MVVWKSLSKRRSLKLTRSRRYKSRRPKSRNVRLGRGKSRRRGQSRHRRHRRKTHTRRHHRRHSHRQRGGTYPQFLSNFPRSLGYSLGGHLDASVPGAIAQATHTPAHAYKKCGNL